MCGEECEAEYYEDEAGTACYDNAPVGKQAWKHGAQKSQAQAGVAGEKQGPDWWGSIALDKGSE